jgi:hypothetical protein
VTDHSPSLIPEYRTALSGYLAGTGEEALAMAYELGREAVDSGRSLLDTVELHAEVLQMLLAAHGTPREGIQRALKATEFLAEWVAPCEMVFRGFQEANATLRQLNQTLEQRV